MLRRCRTRKTDTDEVTIMNQNFNHHDDITSMEKQARFQTPCFTRSSFFTDFTNASTFCPFSVLRNSLTPSLTVSFTHTPEARFQIITVEDEEADSLQGAKIILYPFIHCFAQFFIFLQLTKLFLCKSDNFITVLL